MTADRIRYSYALPALKPHGRVLYSQKPRATYYLNPFGVLFRIRDAAREDAGHFEWVPLGDPRATLRVFRQLEGMPVLHRRAPDASFEVTAERCFEQMKAAVHLYPAGQGDHAKPPAKSPAPPSTQRERADRTKR